RLCLDPGSQPRGGAPCRPARIPGPCFGIDPGSDVRLVILVWLLVALVLVPLLSLPLTAWMGRNAGYVLGWIFLAIAALLVPTARKVVAGSPVHFKVTWVDELGLNLSLRLDGLSLVFIALALIIGALVFFYSPTYFLTGNQRGFYLIMTGFTFS